MELCDTCTKISPCYRNTKHNFTYLTPPHDHTHPLYSVRHSNMNTRTHMNIHAQIHDLLMTFSMSFFLLSASILFSAGALFFES